MSHKTDSSQERTRRLFVALTIIIAGALVVITIGAVATFLTGGEQPLGSVSVTGLVVQPPPSPPAAPTPPPAFEPAPAPKPPSPLVFKQSDWNGGPGQKGPITEPNGKFDSAKNIDFKSAPGSIKIQGF